MLAVPTGFEPESDTHNETTPGLITRLKLTLAPALPKPTRESQRREVSKAPAPPHQEPGPSGRSYRDVKAQKPKATESCVSTRQQRKHQEAQKMKEAAQEVHKMQEAIQDAKRAKRSAAKAAIQAKQQPELPKPSEAASGVSVDLQAGMTMLQGVRQLIMAHKSHEQALKFNTPSLAQPTVDTPSAQDLFEPVHRVIYSIVPQEETSKPPPASPQSTLAVLPRTEAESVCTLMPPNISEGAMRDVIFLIKLLSSLIPDIKDASVVSEALSRKLKIQLLDVLALCSGAVPDWCEQLVKYEPRLFEYSVREPFFNAKSMGVSRTIARLQQDDSRRVTRIGQLVTERVVVPRNERRFLASARRAFTLYAKRRSVLEFAFDGEEGTGVGPTAEFYTLVAMGLQRKDLNMWVPDSATNVSGLFPCLLPEDTRSQQRALEHFKFLGQVLARALIDGRLVDLHLSHSFCKRLCGGHLTLQDLVDADPGLKTLLETQASEAEALSLTMSWAGHDLVSGGSEIDVTESNFHDYQSKVATLLLDHGISQQINAVKEGFNEVVPISTLQLLTAKEFRTMLTGEPLLSWTEAELEAALEPKHGYTRDSPTFRMLLEVLVSMSLDDKKAFLWWATGCPRQPPGGLKKLQPNRLSVVLKKDDLQQPDDVMLSVNVCMKAVKLPEYSSAEILKQRLTTAMHNKDAREFHLN